MKRKCTHAFVWYPVLFRSRRSSRFRTRTASLLISELYIFKCGSFLILSAHLLITVTRKARSVWRKLHHGSSRRKRENEEHIGSFAYWAPFHHFKDDWTFPSFILYNNIRKFPFDKMDYHGPHFEDFSDFSLPSLSFEIFTKISWSLFLSWPWR